MALQIGIVGFPNVGKSTLFKVITKKQVECSNYPFCTIDPNVGVVLVPDERVDKLGELMHSQKKIYTTIEFVDIAGLVEGASKGEGLGNQFLANIRDVDAIVYVLRCFKNEDIVNTRSEINVLKDKEVLDTELALKDLSVVEKRIEGIQKQLRAKNDKDIQKEFDLLTKIKKFLEEGRILADIDFTEEELKTLRQYQLLTLKKRIYLLNGEDGDASDDIKNVFDKNGWKYIVMNVRDELEGAELSQQEREELGLEEPRLDLLIKKSYELLNLITFLTTGEDETRAWTIKKGSTAPQAGGVIHTDFEKGFIKAEVIDWKELLDCEGFAEARKKGLVRTEGKEYIVKDGDVIEIKSGI